MEFNFEHSALHRATMFSLFFYLCKRDDIQVMNATAIDPTNSHLITVACLLQDVARNAEIGGNVAHIFKGAICGANWQGALRSNRVFPKLKDSTSWTERRANVKNRVISKLEQIIPLL
jgi:hypothetical protein